jgi:hypothetical protein
MVVYAIKRKVCLSVRSVTWGTQESAGAENVSRVRFHYNAALISIALNCICEKKIVFKNS